ncbi:ATP-dependent Clp protease, putative [Plasmodium relictum]|uniref:ATP-dependent Clp protease, putative n=1 Tax=Plasmodium relictum TaxID=85471 RepID=A0A1J1HDR7_PLARL|nr:ATP-dependent Clp protease, putative [Plasmodium relictum]CRH04068.1 ATP-dependent Clp protease, putative [Plasmodium relictum]
MNVLYSLFVILMLKIVKNIRIRKKINFLNNSYKINKKETINISRNYRKIRNRNSKLRMSLFEEYDEKCIKALIMAREVAKNDDEHEILLKHLLIAIIRIDSDMIENILKYFNISLTKFLDKFSNMDISESQKENNKKEGYNESISYNLIQNNKDENTKKKDSQRNVGITMREENIEDKDHQHLNEKIISDFIDKHIKDIEHNINLLENSNKEKKSTTCATDSNIDNTINDTNNNPTDNVSDSITDNINDNTTDYINKNHDDNISDYSTDNINDNSNYKNNMNLSDDINLNSNKKDEQKSSKVNYNIKFSEICKLVLQNAVIEAKKKKKMFVNIVDILLSLVDIAQKKNNDFLKYLNELNISVDEFKNQITTYDENNFVSPFNKNINDTNKNMLNNEFNNQKTTRNMNNEHPNQIINSINSEYLNQAKDYRNNDENNFSPNNKLINSSLMKDCLTDMIQLAQEKGDEHFFGRKKEIKRIIEILGRKKKSNPLLIGESGVGKTAIIEHLSYLILKNKIPNHLKNCRIFQLNVGNIVAGTKYRGEFEEKMKILLSNMNKKKKNILFIDEIHVIVGAGSGEGSLDASNLLKPFLSSDNLQCIGTTTFQEYSKYIENDKALRRRFNCVTVNPLTPKETYYLLKKIKYNYEMYHNIYYTNESLKSIVMLSEDYLPTLNFPDKAIDILDEAGAYQKIKYEKYLKQKSNDKILAVSKISMNKDEDNMEKKEDKEENKEENNNKKNNEEGYIKEEINNELMSKKEESKEKNNDKINKIEYFNEERNNEAMKLLENVHMKYVTSDVIENIVSKKSSISYIKKNKKEEEKISKLKEKLNKIIIGQEKVIDVLSKYLFKAITNIKDPNKPIGTLLLCGSSGVGKTLCAQVISKYLFNDDNLIVINMSEYIDKHSVSKLFGSYPGYVGYKEGGELTESVKKKPFSIILFDEIEKAHNEVLHVLLQILDNGLLTDSKGNKISFKNTFIFMTTNIGSDIITDYFKLYNKNYSNLGFKYYLKKKINTNSPNEENKKDNKSNINEPNEEEKEKNNINNKNNNNNNKNIDDFEEKLRSNKWYEELEPEIEEELKKRFLPEFLNRIDEKVIFRQFLKRDIISILENMIDDLKKRIKKRKNLNLIIDKDVINYICSDENNIYDMNFGARSIRRALYKYIEDPIASFLISNLYEPNDSISLNLSNDKKIYVKLLKTSIKQIS